jgi:hypothetical protein
MTHDELLAKIKTGNEFAGIKYAPDSHTFALRAVVELHKPRTAGTGVEYFYCSGCQEPYSYGRYPCETIQTIEKELE